MPQPTQAQLDALKILVNEGDIYIDVEKPADGAVLELLSGANAGKPPLNGTPASPATWVGMTSGPAEFEYKPTYEGVEIEQANGKVAFRIVDEAGSLKFTCAEATSERIEIALGSATRSTVVGGVGEPNVDLMTVGGTTFVPDQCIALVSKIGIWDNMGTPVQLYEVLCAYNVLSTEGVTLAWKRNQSRMVEVTLTLTPDVTRTPGDQLFQHYQQVDPTP